jgi:hypothetical protein
MMGVPKWVDELDSDQVAVLDALIMAIDTDKFAIQQFVRKSDGQKILVLVAVRQDESGRIKTSALAEILPTPRGMDRYEGGADGTSSVDLAEELQDQFQEEYTARAGNALREAYRILEELGIQFDSGSNPN